MSKDNFDELKKYLNECKKEYLSKYPNNIYDEVFDRMNAETKSREPYSELLIAGDIGKVNMIDIILKRLDDM